MNACKGSIYHLAMQDEVQRYQSGDMADILQCFEGPSLFAGLETPYLQHKYYKEYLNLLVSQSAFGWPAYWYKISGCVEAV